MWGCGLKYEKMAFCSCSAAVTPYVGVWIEIKEHSGQCDALNRHPLCGGVD